MEDQKTKRDLLRSSYYRNYYNVFANFLIIKKQRISRENSCSVILTNYVNEHLCRHCKFPNECPFPGLRGVLIKFFSCEESFHAFDSFACVPSRDSLKMGQYTIQFLSLTINTVRNDCFVVIFFKVVSCSWRCGCLMKAQNTNN